VGTDTDVRMNGQGWTQHEQEQMQMAFRIDGNVNKQPITVEADIILAGPQEAYVRVRTLSSTDPASIFRSPFFNLILNQWWKLPSEDRSTPGMSVTPDPRLLEMQMKAMRVTKDHGMAEIDGRLSYHYELALDEQTLMTFLEEVAKERKEPFDREEWENTFKGVEMTGTAWIDAQTFYLNRLQWNAVSTDAQKPWKGTLEMNFSDHDKAPPIAPPTGAQELQSLGELIPGMQSPSDGLTPEAQRKLLESLLKDS
jgi:hypothetical protein